MTVHHSHTLRTLIATSALVSLGLFSGCIITDSDGDDNNTMTGGTTAPPTGACVELENEDVNGGKTLSEGCYTVDSTITVNQGVLKLEPGVTITFDEDAGLAVTGEGRLASAGSMDKPVTLTGREKERGFWKGLYLNESSGSDNALDHTILEYAGSSGWHGGAISRGGIFLREDGVSLDITNSVLRGNAQAGLVADGPNADVTIASTSFEDNEAPMWIQPNLVSGLEADLSFSENDEQAVILKDRSGPRLPIRKEQTWPALQVPYRAVFDLGVYTTLTLSPGTTIIFNQDAGVAIEGEGRLTAVGTESEPIVLTGAEKERGFWQGLYFNDTRSADNKLDYVTLEYAGSSGWHGGFSSAGIFVREDGVALSITNSMIRHNAVTGLLSDGNESLVTIASTSFEDNESPLMITADNVKNLAADLTFAGNDADHVIVNRTAVDSVTQPATWEALAVPYLVHSDLTVRADLTLSPGTTFLFNQGVGLAVNGGALIADASDGDPIAFMGAEGEATLAGFWKGLGYFNSFTASNVLRNVTIAHAGGDGWDGGDDSSAAIFLDGGNEKSSVTLEDVTLSKSGHYAISARDESVVTCNGDVSFSEITGDDNVDSDDRYYTRGGGVFMCTP